MTISPDIRIFGTPRAKSNVETVPDDLRVFVLVRIEKTMRWTSCSKTMVFKTASFPMNLFPAS